jgi:hypothetical protein
MALPSFQFRGNKEFLRRIVILDAQHTRLAADLAVFDIALPSSGIRPQRLSSTLRKPRIENRIPKMQRAYRNELSGDVSTVTLRFSLIVHSDIRKTVRVVLQCVCIVFVSGTYLRLLSFCLLDSHSHDGGLLPGIPVSARCICAWWRRSAECILQRVWCSPQELLRIRLCCPSRIWLLPQWFAFPMARPMSSAA